MMASPSIGAIEQFLDPILNMLKVAAPIIGGLGSAILAILYYYQFNTLEEQRKLSKSAQCPRLIGPSNLTYDPHDEKIYLEVSNVGNGPALNVTIGVELRLEGYDGDGLKGGVVNTFTDRFGESNLDSVNIEPHESNVRLETGASFLVPIIDNIEHDNHRRELHLDEVISELREYDVERAQIRFKILYRDQFGEDGTPFGQEYRLDKLAVSFGLDDIDRDEVMSLI